MGLNKIGLFAAILLNLSGCGVAETLSKGCGGELDPVCDVVLGGDADRVEQIADNEAAIDELRVMLLNEILTLRNSVEILEHTYGSEGSDVTVLIDMLQSNINTILTRLAVLEGYSHIVEFIDPCGDKPGHFDEVVMRTNDGQLLAYFDYQGREFLTLLTDGWYTTTDRQRCLFQVRDGRVL